MKKGKMILSALALFVALGAAYAFNTKALPGNLYYLNDDNVCVAAPCSTIDEIGNACQLSVFKDAACSDPHTDPAYTTDGGGK